MLTGIQAVGLVCAFLVFGGRGLRYFILAAMYAPEEVGRGAGFGLGLSGLLAWMVAVAFPLELVDSGRFSDWLLGVIVTGIVIGELNAALWRRKLGRARAGRVDMSSGDGPGR